MHTRVALQDANNKSSITIGAVHMARLKRERRDWIEITLLDSKQRMAG